MLWIVGQWIEDFDDGKKVAWEFQGVFDTEEKAVTACVTRNFFVGPVELNVPFPLETLDPWPGSYYPLRKPEDPDYNNDRET